MLCMGQKYPLNVRFGRWYKKSGSKSDIQSFLVVRVIYIFINSEISMMCSFCNSWTRNGSEGLGEWANANKRRLARAAAGAENQCTHDHHLPVTVTLMAAARHWARTRTGSSAAESSRLGRMILRVAPCACRLGRAILHEMRSGNNGRSLRPTQWQPAA